MLLMLLSLLLCMCMDLYMQPHYLMTVQNLCILQSLLKIH